MMFTDMVGRHLLIGRYLQADPEPGRGADGKAGEGGVKEHSGADVNLSEQDPASQNGFFTLLISTFAA
jgi:hypothetical protein